MAALYPLESYDTILVPSWNLNAPGYSVESHTGILQDFEAE